MTLETKKGFTLVEMLVVISIIGILAGLALVSFAKSQKQARDTQRKSDLRQYQTSLEQSANSSGGLYPAHPAGSSIAAEGDSICGDLSLTVCPLDPKNEGDYIYGYISDGTVAGNIEATVYSLWTALEGKPDTFWIVCSNGNNGESDSHPVAGGAVCPL